MVLTLKTHELLSAHLESLALFKKLVFVVLPHQRHFTSEVLLVVACICTARFVDGKLRQERLCLGCLQRRAALKLAKLRLIAFAVILALHLHQEKLLPSFFDLAI